MNLSAKLGYVFIAPALILVLFFFLTPVIMTGVFSFTNMSTATGITGGVYLITPSVPLASTLETLLVVGVLPE